MRVKNWREFQHYKHRDPPWIKLHKRLLNDRQWHELDGDSAKVLINLWMIASEADGELPSAADLAFRLRITEKQLNSTLSKLSHWVEQDASTALAPRLQHADTETETEKMPPNGASGETEEVELFKRGKLILGGNSGGLIASLLKSKKGSVALARAAIEQASTKQNPREYIGAVIRGPVHERHGLNDPLAGIV